MSNEMLSFYSMKQLPFSRSISSSRLLLSENAKEVIGRLGYAAKNQQFAVLYGSSGIGKSSVLRYLSDKLPTDQYVVLNVEESQLSPPGLYRNLMIQMGCKPPHFKGDARRAAQKYMTELLRERNKKMVCIIDEAQELPNETLSELRFFLNMKLDSESPAALILSGQNELIQKLKLHPLESLCERINRFAKLCPLDEADTARYIRKHLEYAEAAPDIFSDKATELIYKLTNGIPRRINVFCENCLIYGAQQQKLVIDDFDVKNIAANELNV